MNKNETINIDSNHLDPKCSICNKSTAKIEIVNPNGYPENADKWARNDLERYNKYRDFNAHYLIYSGPGGSNGSIGDLIDLERKERLQNIFSKPYGLDKIQNEFYDVAGCCIKCEKFYCTTHWDISSTGYGICPLGHGQPFDPHR